MKFYEWLKEQIEREQSNMDEARRLAGNNSPGFNQSLGAAEAYQYALDHYIEFSKKRISMK